MRRVLALLLFMVLVFTSCTAAPSLTVKPVSPLNGSEVLSLSPMILWGSGGSATAFRLLVAADSNFQQLIIDANNLGEPRYTVPSGKLKNSTTYYWKVIASKGNATSDWSPTWSFQTPGGEPPSQRGTIRVSATVDGAPWSGAVNYAISGPFSDTDNSLPWNFSDVPTGTYTITYNYGGPPGAVLASITPSPSQNLPGGGTIHFILNFHKQSASSIAVNAMLDGAPWTGPVSYSLSGAYNITNATVPQIFGNVPAGAYTLQYGSGGPPGAVFSGITPAATQTLAANGNIIYTLNFSTMLSANISVSATLNGAPWYGIVRYAITGPVTISRNDIPFSLNSAPPGTYTVLYEGGGPPGATLAGITPAPSQVLGSGQSVVFNLNFVAQPSYGTITVNALLDGQPWRVAIGSGTINYSLTGPRSLSGNTIPGQFSGMPAGPYTLTYHGGGPSGATLTGISPAPLQNLPASGTIVYTLNFTAQPKGTVVVRTTVNGQPWSGQIGYTVNGPYVESGSSTPRSFSNAPAGTYTLQYRAGGPPGSIFEGISPPTQVLPPNGTITFTIMFKFQGLPPQPTPGPMPGPLVK